jgi:hypothetical protein
VTPPYAAELRVYEPLAAFDVDERRAWLHYAQDPSVPSVREAARRERELGLAAAAAPRPRVPRPGEGGELASVLRGESGLLICPWRTELRTWEAAVQARVELSGQLGPLALPSDEVDFAATEHQKWLASNPTRRSHLQQNRWTVPVRWFVLFDREERRLQLAPDRSLVYRTPMAHARRRMARALAVLRKSFDDGPVVLAVESTGRWLEEFHPRSVVELDYAGLVDLRSDEQLRGDDSAGDLAEALSALGRGDSEAASVAYDRVMERWQEAQRVESAN